MRHEKKDSFSASVNNVSICLLIYTKVIKLTTNTMQRVLSYQMAQGFGDTSEFVTKRMCCSFIFSVGFLSILLGFFIGRFATEKSVEYRIIKEGMKFAGNGLESTQDLQYRLIEELAVDDQWDSEHVIWRDSTFEPSQIKTIVSELSLFHTILGNGSSIEALVRGSREPDRYVVLSTSGEDGIRIALKLAKAYDKMYREYNWMSRRTIIFCFHIGSSDSCPNLIPHFMRNKVVAYLTVQGNPAKGPSIPEKQNLDLSGSDIIKAIVLETFDSVQKFNSNEYKTIMRNPSLLKLDIPNAIITLRPRTNITNSQNERFNIDDTTLAQIIALSIWKFSESLVLRWDNKYLDFNIEDKSRTTLDQLLSEMKHFNEKIENLDGTRSMDTRIMNDLVMDLEQALLCTDWDSVDGITLECYRTAIEILKTSSEFYS